MRPERELRGREARPLPSSTLGYRGLLVEQSGRATRGLPKEFRVVNGDTIGKDFAARPADPGFEEFVCGSTGPIRRIHFEPRLPEFILKEIAGWTISGIVGSPAALTGRAANVVGARRCTSPPGGTCPQFSRTTTVTTTVRLPDRHIRAVPRQAVVRGGKQHRGVASDSPSIVVWTDPAIVRADLLGITRSDVEDAVMRGHAQRTRNTGAADWLVPLGRLVVAYNHPDAGDPATARIVTLWRRS